MASENHHSQVLFDVFSPWKIFLIIFFSVLFFTQATRDIIIDRGIITTIAPLIGVLFCGCILGGLLPKYLSNKILMILFGGVMFIGKLMISIPDNTEGYQLYNFGIYTIFLSFPIFFISIFGIINMQNSIHKSYQLTDFDIIINPISMGVSGILVGFIYNWFLRAIDYIQNLLLNLLLSCFFLIIVASVIFQSKFSYYHENMKNFGLREIEERKALKKIPHAGKNARIILLFVPCYVLLGLSFSYPELYAYLGGMSYHLVIALFSGGIVSGIILTSIMMIGSEKNTSIKTIKQYYQIILPILAILTSIIFGLIAFYPSGLNVYGIIYFIAGLVIASIVLLAFIELIQKNLIDLEKIIMYTLIISFIVVFGIKGISVERYMPYLEFLISLCFTIPSFNLLRLFFKNRSKEVFHHE